jgi:purine-nucleoside phosphorylase
MLLVLNLGNPSKSVSELFPSLGQAEEIKLILTGVRLAVSGAIMISTPVYGAGMTRDALQELSDRSFKFDCLVLVGSMGSMTKDIALGDIIAPLYARCKYYGYDGEKVFPDESLLEMVIRHLKARECSLAVKRYGHGSSFAVYDHNFDHNKYKSKLYGSDITGVDCGEVFIGLHFAREHKIRGAALVYCSDDPSQKIARIPADQFNLLAHCRDRQLNSAAYTALQELHSFDQ